MKPKESILIVGTGELGGIVLELLCRQPGNWKIVTADANKDWGWRKTNSALMGASYLDLYPDIEFQEINLLDVERTAELLARIDPAIIYNGTTLQSWWVVNELPPEVNAQIYRPRCGLGPWVAMHLALSSKLMKAVDMSGIDTHVINSSFPDATNPSLSKVGLRPCVGIGNMDLIIPYLQRSASQALNIPMANIEVEMIGHHYHGYNWCRNGTGYEAPHHLRIFCRGEDLTEELGDLKSFVAGLPDLNMRPAGRHGQYLVAGSSVKNIMAIFNDSNLVTHAPGPEGLEGGYPVRLNRQGAEVVLPRAMTLDQARDLMCQAQQYDGIERIEDNGDIVLTDESYETFKELFGVDCRRVTIEDSLDQAQELRHKFEEFARQQGVVIPY